METGILIAIAIIFSAALVFTTIVLTDPPDDEPTRERNK